MAQPRREPEGRGARPRDEDQNPEREARAEAATGEVNPADAPVAPPADGGPAVAVRSRPEQYLIGKKEGAQLREQDFDLLAQALDENPAIEVVRRITPPGIAGVLAAAAGPGQTIFVARMETDRAENLRQNARGSLVVEPDHLLSFADPSTPPGIIIRDPGVVTPANAGFTALITVLGDGAPVAGANVYLFGSVWPAQGVTDGNGQVQLTLFGESPATIKGLYVKPKADYWSLWVPNPVLDPNQNNQVALIPLSQTDPNFPGQQTLGWGQKAMRLDQVPPHFRGAGVKVAVIDSGAATSHRDLNGVASGYDIPAGNDRTWSEDTVMHGSHCIGVIAGADNGQGIRGFAPDAQVFAVKIFPGGRFSDLIDGLNRCIEQQVDVANMSLGSDQRSELLEQKIREAKQMGVACIVAAGNSAGPVQYPASSPDVLAVAAIGKAGSFPQESYHSTQVATANGASVSPEGYFSAKFTCFGQEVGVCGPGVAVVSSVPPDNYAAWDGTSMAAPHVAGLAALVLAHHPDFQGTHKPRNAQRVDRLFQILKASAQPVNVGDRARTGVGMPDCVRALNIAAQPVNLPSLPADVLQKLLNTIAQGGGAAAPSPAAGGTGAATQPQPGPTQPDPLDEVMRKARLLGTTEGGLAPQSDTGVPPAPNGRDPLADSLRKAGLLQDNGVSTTATETPPGEDPLAKALEKAGLLTGAR
jgi:subtilisin family serine protease